MVDSNDPLGNMIQYVCEALGVPGATTCRRCTLHLIEHFVEHLVGRYGRGPDKVLDKVLPRSGPLAKQNLREGLES